MLETTHALLTARDALWEIADRLLSQDHSLSLLVEGMGIQLEELAQVAACEACGPHK